jgi:hypothetical protein
MCAKTKLRTYIKHAQGGDSVTQYCDGNDYAVGGGCEAYTAPHVMQWNGPVDASSPPRGWKCSGHGGNKNVWTICVAGSQ